MAKYIFLELVTKTKGIHRDKRREKDFSELLMNIKENNRAPTAVFNLDFKRPLSDKKKYYSIIIFNDTQRMIEEFKKEFPSNAIEEELRFSYNSLHKKIDKYLKSIAQYIKENEITEDLNSDLSYIINYLKFSAIQLLLELQDQYGQYASSENYSPNEIHEKYFGEELSKNYIVKISEAIEPKSDLIKISQGNNDEKNLQYSFTYKQYDTNPSKITDLWDSLKLNKFIKSDTPLQTFRKIFSGKEITNPVKWTGNPSELYYFIKLIHNDLKLVENLKQKHWQVTCECFVDEKGLKFDRSKLRTLKKPELTGNKIEKAVNHLI